MEEVSTDDMVVVMAMFSLHDLDDRVVVISFLSNMSKICETMQNYVAYC
jgi:hypothetical protein